MNRTNRKLLKKMQKQVDELYEYSKALDFLPPRGDGAKMAVAQEVHDLSVELFKNLEKSRGADSYYITLMLLNLVEQILLDKIGDGFTVEEMMKYDGV